MNRLAEIKSQLGWNSLRLFSDPSRFAVIMMSLTLLANFMTGLFTARGLGDTGRGELAAILTTVSFMSFSLGMGIYQAAIYFRASQKLTGDELLGSLLLPGLALGILTALIAQIAITLVLDDQRSEVQILARFFSLGALVAPLAELWVGIIMGDQRFRLCSALRAVPSVGAALAFGLLWAIGRFSVESALIATVACSLPVLIVCGYVVFHTYSAGQFRGRVFRAIASYGIRSHLSSLSGMINGRLGLFLLPIVVRPDQVGHYALASGLAAVAGQVPGALIPLVMPMAARQTNLGGQTVRRMAIATLALGAAVVVPMMLMAPWFVTTIYGSDFEASVLPLQIMAPGILALSVGVVYGAGILALDRPLTAGLGQFVAVGVTLIGLKLVLKTPVTLAAVSCVSSASFIIMMVVNLMLYRRISADLQRSVGQAKGSLEAA